jgi:dTDP-4-dehydrorhamnose reductase
MLGSVARGEMRIAITGAEGQLGSSLQEAFEGHDLLLIDLPEYDVTDMRIVLQIADWVPEAVLHAAAMTDVRLSPSRVYPRAAKVPRRAVLRNFSTATQLGISLRPWEEALQAYFEDRNRAGHC